MPAGLELKGRRRVLSAGHAALGPAVVVSVAVVTACGGDAPAKITKDTSCRDYINAPSDVRHDAAIRISIEVGASGPGNPMWALTADAACGSNPDGTVGAAVGGNSGGNERATQPSTTAEEDSATEISGREEVLGLLDGVPQRGRVLGEPTAPVTILEFIDFQCPFCREFALSVFPIIVRDYVRAGKVRVELQPLTFIGPESTDAARAAAAAGAQNKEWTFTQLFFFNQQEENSGYVTDSFIGGLHDAAGVDIDQANAYVTTPAAGRAARGAQKLATRYDVASAPSFVIGPTGGPLRAFSGDASDVADFTSAIDQALPR